MQVYNRHGKDYGIAITVTGIYMIYSLSGIVPYSKITFGFM